MTVGVEYLTFSLVIRRDFGRWKNVYRDTETYQDFFEN